MAYQNYIIPKYFKASPTVALIDVGKSLLAQESRFSPVSSQILGRLTSPVEKSPFTYEVRLPVLPIGEYVDVDFDGKEDRGVQVFAAVIATNLFGDGYLEQLEQSSGFYSILTERRTGRVKQGSLLVYAPDDQQSVPAGAGQDGIVFTEDDPVGLIPQGFCVIDIGKDGSVTLRYGQLVMNLLEEVSSETPDFSQQGILQSFHSLVDLLADRYAYTEYRKVDWNDTRRRFTSRVAECDKAGDFSGYADVLRDLAFSLKDGHVNVITPYSLKLDWLRKLGQQWSGSCGVSLAKLSDGRVVVTAIRNDSTAAQAGWTVGVTVLKVMGKSIQQRLDEIPQLASSGIQETIDETKLRRLLSFPLGSKVEVEYLLPGEATPRTTTLTAETGEDPGYSSLPRDASQPFGYEFLHDGMIGYVQWRSFEAPNLNIANWEHFLGNMVGRPAMIIDLRGNTGGLETLYYTMASYLFAGENPAPVKWSDRYEYDAAAKTFVLESPPNARAVFSPRSDLAYLGKVIVLVDSGTASSAEFFAKYLQLLGRARVVSEMSTDGAGGSMRQVLMPSHMVFTYTGGRVLVQGGDEPVIEGIGVVPDLRIETTLESELAKFRGRDVVLEEAVRVLKSEIPSPG